MMTTVYKLTKPDLTTYGGFRYEPGQRYLFPGTGELCGPGYSHAYTSAPLALLLNPIHAHYVPCRLWRADGEIAKTDHGLKVGCRSLCLVAEIAVPDIPLDARVTFGIWCALAVYPATAFRVWAEAWLGGTDRSAAGAAQAAAGGAVARAVGAVEWAAARAAGAAEWAAEYPLNLEALAAAALTPWEPDVRGAGGEE